MSWMTIIPLAKLLKSTSKNIADKRWSVGLWNSTNSTASTIGNTTFPPIQPACLVMIDLRVHYYYSLFVAGKSSHGSLENSSMWNEDVFVGTISTFLERLKFLVKFLATKIPMIFRKTPRVVGLNKFDPLYSNKKLGYVNMSLIRRIKITNPTWFPTATHLIPFQHPHDLKFNSLISISYSSN